jgi:hypothetical protein
MFMYVHVACAELTEFGFMYGNFGCNGTEILYFILNKIYALPLKIFLYFLCSTNVTFIIFLIIILKLFHAFSFDYLNKILRRYTQ